MSHRKWNNGPNMPPLPVQPVRRIVPFPVRHTPYPHCRRKESGNPCRAGPLRCDAVRWHCSAGAMSSVCDSVVRDIGPDQMSPLPLLPLRHLANLSRAARRRAYLGASRPEMGKRERERERKKEIDVSRMWLWKICPMWFISDLPLASHPFQMEFANPRNEI